MTTRYEGASAADISLGIIGEEQEIGADTVPGGEMALCFTYDEVFYIQGKREEMVALLERGLAMLRVPEGRVTATADTLTGELRCPRCGNGEFGYRENCVDYRTPGGQNPAAKTVSVISHIDGTADSGDSDPGLFCDDWRGGGCGAFIDLPDGWDIAWD